MTDNEGRRLLENEDQRLLEDVEHPLENLDMDLLLENRLGEFGRYQRTIYFLVCLPAALTAAITMGSVFNELVPPHRCQVPVCDSGVIPHYADANLLGYANFTLPQTKDGWDECNMYQEISNKSCSSGSFSTNLTQPCSRFLYAKDTMESTVVTDFNLVCTQSWKAPLSNSIFFSGVLVGALVYGELGDIFGRKNVFMLCILQCSLGGILSIFSTDFTTFSTLQFFTAMGQVGLFQCSFVLGIELVGRNKRVFCGIIIEFFFVFGELILALAAWILRDWKKIVLSYSVPGLLFFSYYFFLPRSIRWLISKRRFKEAELELQRIAKWNGVEPLKSENFIKFRKPEPQEEVNEEHEGLLSLLRRPKLTGRLLTIFFCWTVTTLVYYGLSFSAASLAGDAYLDFTLLALAEFPGYTLSYLGMQYWGRKYTLSCSLLVAGVSCLASSILPASWPPYIQTIFFLLGKLGATASFGTAYLYTSELFPTPVRNLCVGLSSMTGRIGAITSPYILDLGEMTGVSWAPMGVFAAGAITSKLLVGCLFYFYQKLRVKSCRVHWLKRKN
ncbi:organic cation transporter protein isoform X2 [Eurytemora carolleeae]|uniref:organic cation transporter protein isoform X2 n=1 Tax=Eurytemora carolleeae TaxID=1294199 RepID=UPI000C765943|nr:organic cation transporter protein isoform X2 [Eurytemora carolleeae]|eukprot:XP_023344116.1 organic cation transporter protein-like isoform X2 [Eurytemora affinis]